MARRAFQSMGSRAGATRNLAGGLRSVRASVPLAFLGSAINRSWVRTAIPIAAAAPSARLPLPANDVFDGLCAVVLLLLALASLRAERKALVARAALAGAALETGVACALCVGASTGNALATTAFWLLGAIGFSLLSASWVTFYASLNPVRAVLAFCLSRIASEILTFALSGYTPAFALGWCALLPSLAYASLRTAKRAVTAETGSAHPIPWKPVAFSLSYAFAFNIIAKSSDSLGGYPMMLVYLVPPCVIATCIVFFPQAIGVDRAYSIICPLMLLAVLVPVVTGGVGTLSALMAAVSYNASSIVIMFIVAGLAYHRGVSPVWAYGVVEGARYVGMFAGSLAARATGWAGVTSLLAVFGVLLATTALLSERRLDATWGITTMGDHNGTGADGDTGRHAARCAGAASAAELYHLTPRESEVLGLLVRGMSVDEMADDLILARGTVKAHVAHIYQKIGVHSHAELIARLHIDS